VWRQLREWPEFATAIWGAMCSADTEMWDHHLGELLTHFVGEFRACGGPSLDLGVLTTHVLLYAAVMGPAYSPRFSGLPSCGGHLPRERCR
jgi:hypothetical protein